MTSKEKHYIEMVNQNHHLIYKISSLYTNTKEDREDLMQEIALQLWKSFDGFKDRSKRSTWLYRVGMNTAIQFLKKEKRKIKKQSLNIESGFVNDDLQNGKNEAIQKMLLLIQNLNPLEKGIILLYLEEKDHKEIAEIVGISITNVGTRIQRIKQKLKRFNSK